jgi:hypothetical protein
MESPMNANQVAVHEVDGRRMHTIVDGLVEAAVTPAEARRSSAYQRAEALLSLYRSRVDFLEDDDSESTAMPLYRFRQRPVC